MFDDDALHAEGAVDSGKFIPPLRITFFLRMHHFPRQVSRSLRSSSSLNHLDHPRDKGDDQKDVTGDAEDEEDHTVITEHYVVALQ